MNYISKDISKRLMLRVRERAVELYGEPFPKVVNDRIEEELYYVTGTGADEMLLVTAGAFKEIGVSTEDIPVKSNCGGSYLAYLLGINGGINPLRPHYRCANCKHSEFDEHKYACVGADLPNEACPVCGNPMIREGFNIDPWFCYDNLMYGFEYFLPTDKFSAAIEIFRRTGCIRSIEENANTLSIHFSKYLGTGAEWWVSGVSDSWALQTANQLSRLADLTGVPLGRIPLDYFPDTLTVRSALSQGASFIGIHQMMNRYIQNVLTRFKLRRFYDYVRLFGICYGAGVWFGNGELLLKGGTITQDELPVCLEDVFDYLQKAGFNRETAFTYTKPLKEGNIISVQQENALHSHGVPRWFITSFKKTEMLDIRSKFIYDALMAWRLLYYKICVNLEAFYRSYLETADINMELCWSISNGETKLGPKLEGLLYNDSPSCQKDEYTLWAAKEIMEQGFAFRGLVRHAIDFRQINPSKKWTQKSERSA